MGRLFASSAVTALVSAFAAATPAVADTPFGIPLGTSPFTSAPNNTLDCSSYLTVIGAAPLYGPAGPPSTATSCIWIHVVTPSDLAAFPGKNISLEPPGTGTVTQVRVGVGATTGPMQVVVMRALYENTVTPGKPNDACCFPVARSQPFTPAANSITTVNVNLPVREDATPPPDDLTTIADFDTIGLAVLEPGVPVPMYYSGSLYDPADFVWNTSTPSTVTPGFSTDTGGFFVAMQGEWAATPAPPLNPIELGANVGSVNNGTAGVPLQCLSTTACVGRLVLQNGPAPGAKVLGIRRQLAFAARAKLTSYGSRSFTLSASSKRTVAVHLSRSGRSLLARHRTVTVWANVALSPGTTGHYSFKLKLKRRR